MRVLEVVKLSEVLDGLYVVMGQERDETNARSGTTVLCNVLGHLEAREIANFAGLGTLGHLTFIRTHCLLLSLRPKADEMT